VPPEILLHQEAHKTNLPLKSLSALKKHLPRSVASKTNERYNSHWKKFIAWFSISYSISLLFSHNLDFGLILAGYLAELIEDCLDKNIGPTSVEQASSAIKYQFQMVGYTPCPFNHPYCARIISSAKNQLVAKQLKRIPFTSEILFEVIKYHLSNGNTPLNIYMHLVCALIGFVGFLRFDDIAHILVHEDFIKIIEHKDGTIQGALIYIYTSKTDKQCKGSYIGIGATNRKYCPIKLLLQLLDKGGYIRSHPTHDCGPLLRATKVVARTKFKASSLQLAQVLSTSPISSLSRSSFSKSINRLCWEAGIPNADYFKLHSLRSGGATAAIVKGHSNALVCKQGRWKFGNTMEDHYLKIHHIAIKQVFDMTRSIWPY
jgi:hypothetical protein